MGFVEILFMDLYSTAIQLQFMRAEAISLCIRPQPEIFFLVLKDVVQITKRYNESLGYSY